MTLREKFRSFAQGYHYVLWDTGEVERREGRWDRTDVGYAYFQFWGHSDGKIHYCVAASPDPIEPNRYLELICHNEEK